MKLYSIEPVGSSVMTKWYITQYLKILTLAGLIVVGIYLLPHVEQRFSISALGGLLIVIAFISAWLCLVEIPVLKSLDVAPKHDVTRAREAADSDAQLSGQLSRAFIEQGNKLYNFQIRLVEGKLYSNRQALS